MLGRTVSHYKILNKLGEGGMGVVYQALDLRLNRSVALKFLHPSLANSSERVASLEKEALAISALNHPSIATIYGIEEADEYKFIVLEYLPGGTLKSRIAESRASGIQIPLGDALAYAIQIAEGLAHAHEHGIIHRDIKSSNILFTAQGTIKIVDFSLASSHQDSDTTSSLPVAGTPSSMSPEQAQGKALDHRSDIFSVGIVVFELLTGEMPFRATRNAVLLQQIISAPAPPLGRFRVGIPRSLEAAVSLALLKDREMRYQGMTTLATDLKSVLKQLDQRPQEVAALATITIAPVPAGRSRMIRKTVLVSSLLAASLLAAYLGTYELPFARQIAMTVVHSIFSPRERRLVVLNFVDSTNSPELCDGLMDVISSKLTEMEQFQGSLLVISPSEVRKAEVHTPSEALEAFGANLAITGSVRRLGSKMEIIMNLVDTETLGQRGSFPIETDFPPPPSLQDTIVSKVTEMLDISLSPSAFVALQVGNTNVPSAYSYYVAGRGYLQRVDNIEYLGKAIVDFQKAIQLDSGYALAYSGLAQAWLDQFNSKKDPRSVDEAVKSASRAVELNGKLAEVRVTMGRALSAKGRYEEAEQEFQRALKIDPVNAEAFRRLARTYQYMNRQDDAERTYKKAVQLRPNDWRGYQSLGNYYFNNWREAEAVRYYRRVLDLTPGNYNAYNDLGAAYLRMGDYAAAVVQLNKSVALKPLAMNYGNLGAAYSFQGRFKDATRCYEKAVAAASTNSIWWGNLADAYRWTPELSWKAPGAYHKAVVLGQNELNANARDSRLRSRLALYFAGLGDKDSATGEIAEALRLSRDDGYVLFRAALVYEQQHNRVAARNAIQAALQAGYPAEEIRTEPILENLRTDPKYQSLFGTKNK